MALKDYRWDGHDTLHLNALATDAGEYKKDKEALTAKTEENLAAAAVLQEKLYADKREGLIIVIQARDAAGKDSLIKKVLSQLNAASLTVHSFKAPSKTELAHDYLWRINACLPERGCIAVFNRSHYEDVLPVKVHSLYKNFRLPERCLTGGFIERRYRQIANWEQYLTENGYRLIKVMLNVSKDEQKRRFLDRMELPEKHWKLSTDDMKERAVWDEYTAAFEDAVNATATEENPWYILPADTKWYTRYLMSEILLKVLTEMDPQYPPLDPAETARIPHILEELNRQA